MRGHSTSRFKQLAEWNPIELEGAVNPRTYYRSYVASMVRKPGDSAIHSLNTTVVDRSLPRLAVRTVATFTYRTTPILIITGNEPLRPSLVGAFTPGYHGYGHRLSQVGCVESVFTANDGVVPVFSQWHPFDCM